MGDFLDVLPPSQQEAARSLLTFVLDFCRDQIATKGGFSPTSFSLDSTGSIQVGSALGKDATESLELLMAGLREAAAAGEITASALCSDIRCLPPGASEKVDAIRVTFEHAAGMSADVIQPYEPDDDDVRFGAIIAQHTDPEVFAADNRKETRRPWWKPWS